MENEWSRSSERARDRQCILPLHPGLQGGQAELLRSLARLPTPAPRLRALGPAAMAAPPHQAAAAAPGPAADAPQGAAAAPPFDGLRKLSAEGALRTGGSLRSIVSASHGVEGLVGLHGGLPPDGVFPLAALSFTTAGGATVQLDAGDLAAAQQYNMAASGHPPLQRWAAAHVAALHAPPGPCGVLVTDGTSHALEMVCSLFVDSGDAVLVEEYSYPQVGCAARHCCMCPPAMQPLPHGAVVSCCHQPTLRPPALPCPARLPAVPGVPPRPARLRGAAGAHGRCRHPG